MYEESYGCFDSYAFVLLWIGVLALVIWSLVWVYRDARMRGHQKPGLITFMCFLCNWPFSLIMYVIMRKEHTNDYIIAQRHSPSE